MRILVQTTGGDGPIWVADLQCALPAAAVRLWQAGDTADADFALVWRPGADLFAERPSLRAIFNLGAGVDAILDLERRAPGILPAHVPLVRIEDGGMAMQMAEYAAYAVLRHMRRFRDYELLQAKAEWRPIEPHDRGTFAVAVLGLGALGAHVAQTLARFGLPIRGFSRRPKAVPGVINHHGDGGLASCLAGAKAVVNLLPNTVATQGILDRDAFAQLADGALVVNLGRGAQIVDADLIAALDSGKLAAAMLDVFNEEPLPADHPFWRDPRITVTPHVSALTRRHESLAQIVAKIEAIERGDPIGGIVDRTSGY